MSRLFTLIMLLASIALAAQEDKSFKVNPGEKITSVLQASNSLYQYPQFMDGVVTYKHGGRGGGLMNYNRLIGEIQFIDKNKDTISLGNENEIELIQLGKDSFYFQQGYLQLLDNFSVKIAKQVMLELTNTRRIGGFGENNLTATTFKAFWNNGMKELPANEVLTFT